ncbi:MAG: AAA family ATPase [Alphaproteobacteria bacterium]|jgi:lon-related putative ATP-dependent protease|nr:AAA family ATPase [Alphaproteobacteria bacterium]
MEKFKLSIQQVYKSCSVEIFKDIKDTTTKNRIEQKRALESINMGVNINSNGYNIFAMGADGIGKKRLILEFLNNKAKDRAIPKDWVYVYNFENPEIPNAIAFPAGEAKVFKKHIDKMILDLSIIIPSIFEGEAYQNKIIEITKSISAKQQQSFEKLSQQASESNLLIAKTQNGFSIMAANKDKKPYGEEDFNKLSVEQKDKISSDIKSFQQKLEKILSSLPLNEKEKQIKIASYNEKVIEKTLKPFVSKLLRKWATSREVVLYLEQLLSHIIENYSVFLPTQKVSADKRQELLTEMFFEKQMNVFKVNVIVDKSKDVRNNKGAPVIYLDNPNYGKLFGKVEYSTQMGTLSTDFTNIKAGYLHQANGGYLLINAIKLLEIPILWESLKQVIKDGKIQFLTPESTIYNSSLVSLEPEPIPLDIKIILVGEPNVYYALWQYDPEFKELFKIVADFDNEIPYNQENSLIYYSYIKSVIKENKLKDFNNEAIAKIVELGAVFADSQEFLSANLAKIKSIVIEANYLARTKKINIITEKEVAEAYKMQRDRSGKFSESMEKFINKKIILVETNGSEVGQVNGLSVFSINDFMFGQPQRISASVYKGKNGVVDIERVVALSGAIHHKGIMILQSFLNSRLGQVYPLGFSASIVFEQSYGPIDGDSATSTELYALLSALSNVPIKQNFAVTGSMDQKGRIQAIGGVNHKIEGFFKICKNNGLTGEHGVIIPKSNIPDLMLSDEVREAIEKNLFNIYAISHADEGIEILTGIAAGTPDSDGKYPESSIYGKIQKKWLEIPKTENKESPIEKKNKEPENKGNFTKIM